MNTQENAFIRIIEAQGGQQLFALNNICFDLLYADDVIRLTGYTEMKVLYGTVTEPMIAYGHSGACMGDSGEYFNVFGRMYKDRIAASEFFAHDIIYFTSPMEKLEQNIIGRWYSLKKLESPWKERFADLEAAHDAESRSLDDQYLKEARRTKKRIKYEDLFADQELLQQKWSQEHNVLWEKMKIDLPAPRVLLLKKHF